MQLQLKKNRSEKPPRFAQDFHPRWRNPHETVWLFCCWVHFFNHEFLTHPFWCDLKIWLMLFTRDKQFDNSNLTKASNWKPFPWSLFDTACVKWVCHLHPALKLWHNWIQPNLENIPDRSKSLLEERAGKCNSYYPEKKTKTSRARFG